MTTSTTAQDTIRARMGLGVFSFALLAYGAVMGGGLYQLIAEVPNWSARIPDTLITYRTFFHASHPGHFFQTLMPLTILSLIAATVLLWNRPRTANRWMLISLGGVVVTEVFTIIYFLPRNLTLFFDPIEGISTERLMSIADQWRTANHVRMAIIIATMLAFLKTHATICSGGNRG